MNTLFIGRNMINLSEVDSTNNYALHNSGLPEGTVIRALYQTKGKGQRGKDWQSEPGKNLLFSIVLKPYFLSPERLISLNKAIALALLQSLKIYLPQHEMAIKWPNDLFAADRKLAGILTEIQWSAGHIVSYVAGVGINLLQESFPGINPEPVSVKMLSEHQPDADALLAAICSRLEAYYLMLKRMDFESIDNQFNDALWKRGEVIRYLHGGSEHSGLLVEVDRQGRLLVLEGGEMKYFQTGEIVWVI